MQSSESSLSADASLDAGGGCAADWDWVASCAWHSAVRLRRSLVGVAVET